MKRVFIKLVAITFVFGIFSCYVPCDKNYTMKGNRNIVSQERKASGFHGITIDDVADVNVHTGEDYKVVVTIDSNLQSFIVVEVKNKVLYIDTKPVTRFEPTKVIVDVHLPKLQSININGVGNVKLSDDNVSDLDISLSGVGNIDAKNYQVENVFIKHSGVGDAKIWASKSLSGTLSGVGNIRYKGNPTVNINVTGVGKVSKL